MVRGRACRLHSETAGTRMAVAHVQAVLPVSATLGGSCFPAMASLMKNFWAWLVMARASLQRSLSEHGQVQAAGSACLSPKQRGRCRLRRRSSCPPDSSDAWPRSLLVELHHLVSKRRIWRGCEPLLASPHDHAVRHLNPHMLDSRMLARWAAALLPAETAAADGVSDSAPRGMLPRSLASVPV